MRVLLPILCDDLCRCLCLLLICLIYESLLPDLALAYGTRGCDGRRPGLHHVVRVIIDLIGRLLDLLHLHVQLVRQLLELPPRVRRH